MEIHYSGNDNDWSKLSVFTTAIKMKGNGPLALNEIQRIKLDSESVTSLQV